MRNDSRPLGEHSPASPVGGHDEQRQGDHRDTIAHGRESHFVHRETEEQALADEDTARGQTADPRPPRAQGNDRG